MKFTKDILLKKYDENKVVEDKFTYDDFEMNFSVTSNKKTLKIHQNLHSVLNDNLSSIDADRLLNPRLDFGEALVSVIAEVSLKDWNASDENSNKIEATKDNIEKVLSFIQSQDETFLIKLSEFYIEFSTKIFESYENKQKEVEDIKKK